MTLLLLGNLWSVLSQLYLLNDIRRNNTGAIAGGAVGVVVAFALLFALLVCRRNKKKKEKLHAEPDLVIVTPDMHTRPGAGRYAMPSATLRTQGYGTLHSPLVTPERETVPVYPPASNWHQWDTTYNNRDSVQTPTSSLPFLPSNQNPHLYPRQFQNQVPIVPPKDSKVGLPQTFRVMNPEHR